MDRENRAKPRLHRAVFGKVMTLMLAGFGFVAALAWNGAVQGLFRELFGEFGGNSVIAKFIYAVLITAVVTVISLRLGRDIQPPQQSKP